MIFGKCKKNKKTVKNLTNSNQVLKFLNVYKQFFKKKSPSLSNEKIMNILHNEYEYLYFNS